MQTSERLLSLVAHRGYAQHYPENTLPALEGAMRAGARAVEFDVQLSADGIPFLFHDADLQRTAGRTGDPLELDWPTLRDIEVNESKRLRGRFSAVRIPSLADTVGLLRLWPGVEAFVELKRHSLRRFGVDTVLAAVLETLRPVADRCVIISFDAAAVRRARALGAARVGWVIECWDEAALVQATELVPEYLFCNHLKLPPPPMPLWLGPWRWVIYEVDNEPCAAALAARGVRVFETMAVGRMLAVLQRMQS